AYRLKDSRHDQEFKRRSQSADGARHHEESQASQQQRAPPEAVGKWSIEELTDRQAHQGEGDGQLDRAVVDLIVAGEAGNGRHADIERRGPERAYGNQDRDRRLSAIEGSIPGQLEGGRHLSRKLLEEGIPSTLGG